MIRKLSVILICCFIRIVAMAQTDSSHLRVSLLTCGVGDEIWETFGHNGLRVIDSATGTDLVYNYGTFDGFDKDFELNFMRGKLLYYVSYSSYRDFMQEYIVSKRKVEEQVLIVGSTQKRDISNYLKINALPENKYYKYDFFYDNCATRLRDILPKSLGTGFKYGQVIPSGETIRYRQIMNRYFYKTHWERVGINILLGSNIDRIMTNSGIMFLPDYLRDGLATSTLNGKKVASPTVVLLPQGEQTRLGANEPLLLTIFIAVVTILSLSIRKLRILGRIMSSLLLLLTGLLGCLILVMWFGTDHQGCRNNWNLLWALPTNIVFAFLPWKRKSRYAMVGIVLIFISLLLHLFKVQELPLLEWSPILLSLLFVYGSIYRRAEVKTTM